MPNYVDIGTVAAGDVFTATYLNEIVGDMELLSKHDHSPSAGEGGNIIECGSAASPYVERMYFFPAGRPNTNIPLEFFSTSAPGGQIPDITSASEMVGAVIWGFQINRATACHDWYGIQMPLLKGTYKLQILAITGPNGGTASLEIGASGLVPIDTYSATVSSALCTWSGIPISSTGSYLLRVIQTQSNPNSTSNVTKLGGLTMVRTAR